MAVDLNQGIELSRDQESCCGPYFLEGRLCLHDYWSFKIGGTMLAKKVQAQ